MLWLVQARSRLSRAPCICYSQLFDMQTAKALYLSVRKRSSSGRKYIGSVSAASVWRAGVGGVGGPMEVFRGRSILLGVGKAVVQRHHGMNSTQRSSQRAILASGAASVLFHTVTGRCSRRRNRGVARGRACSRSGRVGRVCRRAREDGFWAAGCRRGRASDCIYWGRLLS